MMETETTLETEAAFEEVKKRRFRPVIGYSGSGVALTCLSVVSAVIGMHFALGGSLGPALICLMFCGFCDMLDGPVARRKKKRTGKEKNYGIELDSLADIVSFGVFPIVIGYSIGTYELALGLISSEVVVHVGIAALYATAALIRLAYFNVMEMELQSKKKKRKYYEGLPVTSVSILIPLVLSISLIISAPVSLVYSIMLLVFAIAFVARIKIPKIRGRYLMLYILLALPIALYIIWNIGG